MKPILSPELPAAPGPARERTTAAYARDESDHLAELLAAARLPADVQARVQATAEALVERTRVRAADPELVQAFMRQYDLSSEEGVLLMCVAEALLRIPDQLTADKLIRDKLGDAAWEKHLGGSSSVLVNASTWGLMLTGRVVSLAEDTRRDFGGAFRRLIARTGEPVIRLAVRQAMKIMGHQFVMGRTIGEALERSRKGGNAAYRYSFDMLGEGALTKADAARYLQAYRDAIGAIGAFARDRGLLGDVFAAPSISVKLSALHPRYEHAKRARVMAELAPAVLELARDGAHQAPRRSCICARYTGLSRIASSRPLASARCASSSTASVRTSRSGSGALARMSPSCPTMARARAIASCDAAAPSSP